MMLAIQLTDNNVTTVYNVCNKWGVSLGLYGYATAHGRGRVFLTIEGEECDLKIGEWLVADNCLSVLSDKDFRLKYEIPNHWKGSYLYLDANGTLKLKT